MYEYIQNVIKLGHLTLLENFSDYFCDLTCAGLYGWLEGDVLSEKLNAIAPKHEHLKFDFQIGEMDF